MRCVESKFVLINLKTVGTNSHKYVQYLWPKMFCVGKDDTQGYDAVKCDIEQSKKWAELGTGKQA